MKNYESFLKNIVMNALHERVEILETNFIYHDLNIKSTYEVIGQTESIIKNIESNYIMKSGYNSNTNSSTVPTNDDKSFVSVNKSNLTNKSKVYDSKTLQNRKTKSKVTNRNDKSTGKDRESTKKSLVKQKTTMNIFKDERQLKNLKSNRGVSEETLKRNLSKTKTNLVPLTTKKSITKTPLKNNPSVKKLYVKTPGPKLTTVKTEENLTKKKNDNPFKKQSNKLTPSNNSNSSIYNKTKDRKVLELDKEIDVSYIIAAEQHSFCDDLLLNKDEPFITEFNDKCDNFKKKEIKMEIEEVLEDRWCLFSMWLDLKDISKFILLNKKFGKLAIMKIMTQLDNDKNNIEEKVNKIKNQNDDIRRNESFILSKGATKAIDLLNEKMYNKVFLDLKTPNSDVLFIYKLYFQIINHPIVKYFNDNNKFWKECCDFMIKESKSKTGNMISDSLKAPFIYKNNTMYKMYRVIQNNMNKINPNFYSRICGTTGLIVFFIKDVIDYLGLTFDKKTPLINIVTNMGIILEEIEIRNKRLEYILETYFNYLS